MTTIFEPIKAKRAFEEVVEQIRQAVATGQLKPGDRLPPERDFAEQLGVSRNAVREAMRTLENAGFVECHQGMGGGAFIRSNDPEALTRAMADNVILGRIPFARVTEARILLMEQTIRVACDRATAADYAALEADIDKAEQLTLKGDFTRRHSYISEFYRILAEATHNEVVVMLVESLSELTRAQLAKVSPAPRSDVIAVRRKVVSLMRAGDADGAVKEMVAHLRRLDRLLQRHESDARAMAATGT